MGKSPAQENHQPSTLRKYVFELRAVAIQVKAQFAAMFRFPVFVQIEHARQLSLAVAAKLVDMPGVEGARRITGEVTFEFEQAELQGPVQRQPQLFETIQTGPLRFTGRRLLQPPDFIATKLGSSLTPFSAAHRCLAEITAPARPLAVAAQRCRQLASEKIIDHHPALCREAVGDPIEIFQFGESGQFAPPFKCA